MKVDEVKALFSKLWAMELELKANDAFIRKCVFRSHDLRAKITELQEALAKLVGDVPSPLPSSVPAPVPIVKDKGMSRERVLTYLENNKRVVSASEVALVLATNPSTIDVVFTILSKLHAKNLIARVSRGRYCSLAFAQQLEAEELALKTPG